MYKITLSNCGGKDGRVHIDCEVKANSWEQVYNIITVTNGAFRDTQVVDDETGEVVYNRYVGPDYFLADYTEAEALGEIETYL